MDPKKRLQVAAQANPSIRISAAPTSAPSISVQNRAPSISIAAPHAQPTISVQSPSAHPVYQPQIAPAAAHPSGIGGALGNFVKQTVHPFAEFGNAVIHTPQAIYREVQNKPINDIQQSVFGTTNSGKIAQHILGDTASLGLTVAAPGVSRGIEGAIAPTVGRVVPRVLSPAVSRFIAGTVPGAAINTANVASEGELNKHNILPTIGVGAALGGSTDVASPLLGKAFKAARTSLFGPSARDIGSQYGFGKAGAKYLKQETNPDAVHSFLQEHLGFTNDAVRNAAETIAGTNNHGAIGHALDAVATHTPEEAIAGALLKETADTLGKEKAQHAPTPEPTPSPDPGLQVTPGGSDIQLNASHEPATSDLSQAIKSNTSKVANNSAFGDALQQAYHETGIHDPYNLTVNALARMKNKSDVRDVVQQLVGNADPTTINRLTKAVTKASSPDEVHAIIDRETAKASGADQVATTAADTTAPAAQAAPATQTAAQDQAIAQAVAPQSGTSDVGVGATQTAGSPAATVSDFPTTDTGTKFSQEGQLPAQVTQKGPTALGKSGLSITGELSKMGPTGKEVADALNQARNTSEKGQGWFLQQIPSVLKLGKNDFPQFVDTLDALSAGKDPGAVPENIAQAVHEWSQAIPQVRNVANQVGLDVGDQGKFYFPRNYSEMLKSTDGFNAAVQHLVDSGQAKDTGEAVQALRFMQRQYDNKFGHFENSRAPFNIPGYDKSKNTLVNYIDGAFNKIGHAEQFGAKGEKADQAIGQLAQQGHDGKRALDLYQRAIGTKDYGQEGLQRVSNGVRAFNRVRSLGLSALTNLSQSANTATVGGGVRTALAAAKAFTANDKDFITTTGVNADSVLNRMRDQQGITGKVTGKLTAPLFNHVERFNRSVAAVTGRDMANSLAEGAARGDENAIKGLRDLGVKGDIAPEGLTPEQQIDAARGLVEKTQFKTDPQDLPAWADSPLGKMAAQFRTFSYKQTKFMYEEVLQQAAKGNIMPLARFMTIGSALGFATAKGRSALTLQDWTQKNGNQEGKDTNAVTEYLDALNNAGGLGLGSSAKFLAQNTGSSRFAQYTASTVGGPTAGLGVQIPTDVGQALSGSPKALERDGLKTIPVAGNGLSNAILPLTPTGKNAPKDTLTDANGQQIIVSNTKGKPTAATVPKSSKTGLAATVAKDAATKKALGQQFKDSLNSDQQTLLGMTGKTLNAALSSGTITQDQYNQAKALQTAQGNVQNGTHNTVYKVPDGIKSTNSTNFYKEYGKIAKTDTAGRNAFLDGTPSKSAQAITDQINKTKPTGLPDIKPSNRTALAYTQYEQAFNKDGATAIDKRNALKTFWTNVTKQQASADAQDLYKEGGSADLKYLLADGQIDKNDLSEAVGLDDMLYKSGITGSLKFSKSFRTAYGIAIPSGGGTGSSSSSGSSSSRAGQPSLASLLGKTPSFSQAPQVKIQPHSKVDLTTPKLGSAASRRISINL